MEKEELIITSVVDIQKKLVNIKDNDKKITYLLWIINNFIEINKNVYINKYTDIDWDSIINDYYINKNPMRRYIMIHEIISGKYLCKDVSCSVHPPLREIGQVLDSMIFYSLEEAEEKYGENSQNYKMFKKKFVAVNSKLSKVFSGIKIMFDAQNTERFNIERGHRRSLEKIMYLGKAGVPYTARVGSDIDNSIKIDEDMVMPGDKEIISGKTMFDDNIKKERRS